jgi:hypothetical protein
VTSNEGRGGRRYPPYAFTEHGVAMLSSVLRSKRAVQMNILIIRAFVQIRELLATNKELAARVEKLEAGQRQHESIIAILAEEIDQLKLLPESPKRLSAFDRLKKRIISADSCERPSDDLVSHRGARMPSFFTVFTRVRAPHAHFQIRPKLADNLLGSHESSHLSPKLELDFREQVAAQAEQEGGDHDQDSQVDSGAEMGGAAD